MSFTTIRVVAAHFDAAKAVALVRRRNRRLFGLLPPTHECHLDHRPLYWPLDVAVATAWVKPPFRPEREARVAVARDTITGKHGTVDVKLGDPPEVDVEPAAQVCEPLHTDDEEWWEFARNQMVIRYRPTWVNDLTLMERKRIYVPYRIVHCGADSWLVDLMLGRVVDMQTLDPRSQRSLET